MQLFRLAIVIAATLAVVARYLQETHRLSVIKRLPGNKARDYFERTRDRSERSLTVLTVTLAVLAVAAALWVFVLGR